MNDEITEFQSKIRVLIENKKKELDKIKELKIQNAQDKGYKSLAEVVYGVWEDKLHCATALELFNHVVDNNFDMFTPFSEPVRLNHKLVRTPSFLCQCGCNVFYERREVSDNHLILLCTNCDYPNYF